MRNFALEILSENIPQRFIYIGVWKYSRWGPEPGQIGLSVGRPVGRLVDCLRKTCLTVDHPVDCRSRSEPESSLSGSVDRPVDRDQIQEASSLDRSILWSTGPRPRQLCTSCSHRSTELWFGRPVGGPLVGSGMSYRV